MPVLGPGLLGLRELVRVDPPQLLQLLVLGGGWVRGLLPVVAEGLLDVLQLDQVRPL